MVVQNRENRESRDDGGYTGAYTWEQLTQLKRDWPKVYELLTNHPDRLLFRMATGAKALEIDPKTFRTHWAAKGLPVLGKDGQWGQAWKADLEKFMVLTGRVEDVSVNDRAG